MDAAHLEKAIQAHEKWLRGLPEGKRADFTDSDLHEADLSNRNLSKAIFIGSNLRRASLAASNLSGAFLTKAYLPLADLRDADLSFAVARNSTLNGANLTDTTAIGADFSGAELSGTNFFRTELRGACLEETNLRHASLFQSNLDECVFSSRAQLGALVMQLDPHQLEQAIFRDEYSSNQHRVDEDSDERIEVKIDGGEISPYNTSLVLATLNAAYNNLFFLVHYKEKKTEAKGENSEASGIFDTEEQAEERAKRVQQELTSIRQSMKPFYQGVSASDSIFITRMRTGSQIFELATAAAENFPLLSQLILLFSISATTYTWVTREKKKHFEVEKLKAETKKIQAETLLLEEQTKRGEATGSALPAKVADGSSMDLSLHFDQLKSNPEIDEVIGGLPIQSDLVREHAEELVLEAVKPLLQANKRLTAYNYKITISRK